MDSKKLFLSRVRFISVFFIFIGIIVIARLFSLQVLNNEVYAERADRSYVKSKDTFERGFIFFEKKDGGRISAATINTGYILSINPKILKNPEEAYEKINSIIEIDKEEFLTKASKIDDPYEEIKDKITKDKADAINFLDIEGVDLYKTKWRFYPGENMASQTIGFVAYSEDNSLKGQYGIEKYYNETLEKEEKNLYVNVFAEIFSGVKDVIFEGEAREGDVVMTIEPTVQNFLEKELLTIMDKYDSEASSGIIINPQNGEILAMAHNPTFNLNHFNQEKDVSLFYSRSNN